jgi:hypothetical protein
MQRSHSSALWITRAYIGGTQTGHSEAEERIGGSALKVIIPLPVKDDSVFWLLLRNFERIFA